MVMSEVPVSIRGGASPEIAAAVTAVIHHYLMEEQRARSRWPPERIPHAWVRLGSATPFGRFSPPVAPAPGKNPPPERS